MQADDTGIHRREIPLRHPHLCGTVRGREAEITDARDALAERVLTAILRDALEPALPPRCFHLKGAGGRKAAVRETARALEENDFVFRTDVKSYYASVNHRILRDLLRKHVHAVRESLTIHPDILMNYVGQWLCRVLEKDGVYEEKQQGIPTDSSLSPLMGGFYLADLDKAAQNLPVFYVRYMDDVLMLAKKRWHLKKGVKTVHRIFAELHLTGHPDKTFIGRKEKGFDFLGYHFCPGDPVAELTVSEKTLGNFLNKYDRIQAQETRETREQRLQDYTLRWIRWAKAGLKEKGF